MANPYWYLISTVLVHTCSGLCTVLIRYRILYMALSRMGMERVKNQLATGWDAPLESSSYSKSWYSTPVNTARMSLSKITESEKVSFELVLRRTACTMSFASSAWSTRTGAAFSFSFSLEPSPLGLRSAGPLRVSFSRFPAPSRWKGRKRCASD